MNKESKLSGSKFKIWVNENFSTNLRRIPDLDQSDLRTKPSRGHAKLTHLNQ